MLAIKLKVRSVNRNLTRNRAVLYSCRDATCWQHNTTSQSTNVWRYGLVDVYICEVQTLERCCSYTEQWSSQTVDCKTISEDSTLVTLDWSPSLTGQINVCNEQCVLLQSFSLSSKLLQRLYIANYEYCIVWSVGDSVCELAHLAYSQRLSVVSLNGCIHYATLVVVQSDIQLVVCASRNGYVDILWLARKWETLSIGSDREIVVDNRL